MHPSTSGRERKSRSSAMIVILMRALRRFAPQGKLRERRTCSSHGWAKSRSSGCFAAIRMTVNRLRAAESVSFYSRAILMEKGQMSDAVGAGKTVLVVDDHEPTRQTIARMLEAGGFTVRTAENGIDALDRLSRESDEIDIVLSDVTMPGMNGIDL